MCLHNYDGLQLLLSYCFAVLNMQPHCIQGGCSSCQQPAHIPVSEKEEKEASVRQGLSI